MVPKYDEAARREPTAAVLQVRAPLAEHASAALNWITTRLVDTSHAVAVRVESVHRTEEDARATGRAVLEVMFVSGDRRYPGPGDVLRIYQEPPYVFVIAPPA